MMLEVLFFYLVSIERNLDIIALQKNEIKYKQNKNLFNKNDHEDNHSSSK